MLIGHLGGKAYSLRSAIITALGHLVHKAFEHTPGEDADAQGMHPHTHSVSCQITGFPPNIILFSCYQYQEET